MGFMISGKITAPRLNQGIVRRVRLFEKLNTALNSRIFLVTAPAGFGKSTLISQWLESLNCPRTWVNLDVSDSDPVLFWKSVVASLQTIEPELGKAFLFALSQPTENSLSLAMNHLIGDLSKLDNDMVLVLDDFQLVTSDKVDETLAYLLRNLPYQCHVVISSRGEISVPLARLRALGELVELTAEELRFTREEVALFFSDFMNITIPDQALEKLCTRTEGWVTGLQLAGLALKGRKTEVHQAFVEEFSGRNRFVLDYLIEEGLNSLPEDLQAFLLKVSVLNRMDASICTWLTGRDDAQKVLDELVRSGMFLFPIDDQQSWFRFHHLFGDLLRHKLTTNTAYDPGELHRNASTWYAEQKDIDEALYHAFQAEDYETAAKLLVTVADAYISRCETVLVASWLDAFPEEFIHQRADLLVYQAWIYSLRGQSIQLERTCERVDHCLKQHPDPILEGRHNCILAWHCWSQRDLDRAERLGSRAMELLSERESIFKMMAGSALALIHMGKGQLEKTATVASEILMLAQRQASAFYQMHMSSLIIGIAMARGQIHVCEHLLDQAFSRLDQMAAGKPTELPAYGALLIVRAELLRERGKQEEAVATMFDGIALGKKGALFAVVARGLVQLALVAAQKGDFTAALGYVDEATVLSGDNDMILLNRIVYYRILLLIQMGDTEKAQALTAELEKQLSSPVERAFFGEIQGLLSLKAGAWQEAITQLETVREQLESWQLYRPSMRVRFYLLKAYQQLGAEQERNGLLIDTVRKGKQLGLWSTLKLGGEKLLTIVLQAPDVEDELKTFVGELLDTTMPTPAAPDVTAKEVPWSYRMDPLSKRELEVLVVIAEGLTNQEIADKLFISLNTVRTHTKNINSKLGVNSRGRAVAVARDYSLI